jgi:hypothetical protein
MRNGMHLDTPSSLEVRVADAIHAHMSKAHLHPKYADKIKPGDNPMKGHCYVASESFYHIMKKHNPGYKPVHIKHEGDSHWFLQHGDRHLDLTAGQFETPVPYHEGRGKGFLTREPSKRAKPVIEAVRRHLSID